MAAKRQTDVIGGAHPEGWLDTTNTEERRILDLRTIGMRHGLTLGRFHYNRAAKGLPEQCHPSWLVLVFVLVGNQHYRVKGKGIDVLGGQALRILPGQRYSTGDRPEQRGDVAWLILKARPLPGGPALGMTAVGARSVFARLTDPTLPPVFQQVAGTAEKIAAIFRAWEDPDFTLRTEFVRHRIAGLVLDSAAALGPRGRPSAQANARVQRAVRWFHQRLDDAPAVAELAAQAGISCSRFHDEFRRVVGTTPHDYMLRARVEEAARRLGADPQLAVTRVAHDLGFSSSQYFATVFRRYLGSSPRRWRMPGHPPSGCTVV